MAEESVVFEIQVDKKILQQLLTDNENFKEKYEKIIKLEDNIKQLKQLNKKLEEENKEINEENVQLRTTLGKLDKYRRLYEEKENGFSMDNTESRILTMKLQKMESEKQNLIVEFEKEKRILEELLRDNSNFKRTEEELKNATTKLSQFEEELSRAKKALEKIEIENIKLEKEKLNLEVTLKGLNKKFLILEARDNSNELEQVESKLLKLKVQTLENENEYLLDEIEREKKITDQGNKPRLARLEENLTHLRNWIEKQGEKPVEDKLLKEKLETLEKEKLDLEEGFELERKVFRKILKKNQINDLP